MLKKIALLLLLIAPMSVFAQKFGHVKFAEILTVMPEYTKAQTDIQAQQKQYEDEMKRASDELTKKFTEYQQEQANLVRVPNLGIALVLTFHKIGIAALVKLSFYLREGRCQIVRVLRIESRTETVEAVPVDVALGSFRVDVLTVGEVETPVIVLGVIGAVGPGSSVVSC